MCPSVSRRTLLAASAGAAGAAAGAGELGFLQATSPVSAEETRAIDRVMLRPEIEPLVRLMEETPRDRAVEAVAGEIRRGAGYARILGALMLAGVRNIRPHPVGFKFHAVLVVNSAHLASIASPDSERWLPLLWAVDQFKSSQAQDVREGDWTMPALPDGDLPTPEQARAAFVAAMDRWDEPAADRAAARLARVAGGAAVWELMWRYGARDFRDIGHKAIYAANAWRTLQVIGWEHAEPIVRSLAMALLDRGGTRGNPADLDEPVDRPWRRNLERAKRIRKDWPSGKREPAAAAELLAALRIASPDEASGQVEKLLNRGVSPSSLWDGVFLAAGELLMRQPGILGIHCVTSANALRYAADTSADDETRLMTLLQGAAFMAMFRENMQRGGMADGRLDRLPPAEGIAGDAGGVAAVYDAVTMDRAEAARRTLAYLGAGGSPEALMTAARRLIFLKGTNSHDYKFASAALEDYYHMGEGARDRYLAAAMFNLRGSRDRDNPLAARSRAALAG